MSKTWLRGALVVCATVLAVQADAAPLDERLLITTTGNASLDAKIKASLDAIGYLAVDIGPSYDAITASDWGGYDGIIFNTEGATSTIAGSVQDDLVSYIENGGGVVVGEGIFDALGATPNATLIDYMPVVQNGTISAATYSMEVTTTNIETILYGAINDVGPSQANPLPILPATTYSVSTLLGTVDCMSLNTTFAGADNFRYVNEFSTISDGSSTCVQAAGTAVGQFLDDTNPAVYETITADGFLGRLAYFGGGLTEALFDGTLIGDLTHVALFQNTVDWAVPVPAAAVLFLTGFAGLGLGIRRQM